MGPAMTIDNSKISLFPDFSTDVQKRRAQFTDVKKRLRALELQYAMLYPAWLQVVAKGRLIFLEKPSLVQQWLDREENTLREYAVNRRLPT